jgi:hypothetical protein
MTYTATSTIVILSIAWRVVLFLPVAMATVMVVTAATTKAVVTAAAMV